MKSSAPILLTVSLLVTACADTTDDAPDHLSGAHAGAGHTDTGHLSSRSQSFRTYSGDVEMRIAGNNDLFCEGLLVVKLSSGDLSGEGECGGITLSVSGHVTEQGVIRGQIQPDLPNEPALPEGRITGQRYSDGAMIDWSLEIPMPDDPPLEDDLDMLALDGSGWLSLDD